MLFCSSVVSQCYEKVLCIVNSNVSMLPFQPLRLLEPVVYRKHLGVGRLARNVAAYFGVRLRWIGRSGNVVHKPGSIGQGKEYAALQFVDICNHDHSQFLVFIGDNFRCSFNPWTVYKKMRAMYIST